jgi:hypothetical protein
VGFVCRFYFFTCHEFVLSVHHMAFQVRNNRWLKLILLHTGFPWHTARGISNSQMNTFAMEGEETDLFTEAGTKPYI